tara:strand:+ start:2090 stop:2752 length:663 start_codon:yes stop_codon:yes gene_type:complete
MGNDKGSLIMSVENIISVYRMATPEEKRDGIVWYANAYADCKRIAVDCDIPIHIVVGVVAALSPNNKWDRNVTNARDLIEGYLNGDHVENIKVSTYNAMKNKAWAILEAYQKHTGHIHIGVLMDDGDILSILNGQKITSFYQNIMGYDTCTVDGHAKNIFYGVRHGLTDDKTNVGKREYREISQAYVDAGKRVRVNGRPLKAFEIQAITWVVWRRIHNIK